jgi:ATP-dependent protease HslVU (ClpYQ) peptidase subunit
MTCIVALSDGANVWMGADSASVSGLALTLRRDPKIYRVGEMLVGFTSSFRMGQLLGYKFEPPAQGDDQGIEQYMATRFVDALRETLKEGGYARNESGAESAGTFLVAYRGRIFRVDSDYQVGENTVPYDSVGCGAELALGAMYATGHLSDPRRRVEIALEAAEAFSAGVRRPWVIESLAAGN